MDPKMDQKINQKSTPSPPGLLEGPPDGPRSLRDPILDWFLMILDPLGIDFFNRFSQNSVMISSENFVAIF